MAPTDIPRFKPNNLQSIIKLINIAKYKKRDDRKTPRTWTFVHTDEQIDEPTCDAIYINSTAEEQITGLVPDRGKKTNPSNLERYEGHRDEDLVCAA